MGWSKEVLDHVCQEAGITCETVWDKWSNCWNSEAGSHSVGGEGECEVVRDPAPPGMWAVTSRVRAHFPWRAIPSISQGGSKCPYFIPPFLFSMYIYLST